MVTLRWASLQIAAGKKRKAEEAEARARAEEERAAAEDAEDLAAAEQRAKELRNDVAYHREGPGSLSQPCRPGAWPELARPFLAEQTKALKHMAIT